VADSWQRELTERKAIYLTFPQAVPLAASIDRENCLYFQSGVCQICARTATASMYQYSAFGKDARAYEYVKPLDRVVDVNYIIPGCPPLVKLVVEAFKKIINGALPEVGSVLAPDLSV